MEPVSLWAGGVHRMQWQHRSPAYRCRPGRAASLRGNGPAGRVWRAVRRVAVSAPCRAGPQARVRLRRRKLGLYFRLRPLLPAGPGFGRGWRCLCRCCSLHSNSSGMRTPLPSPPDRLRGPAPSLQEAGLQPGAAVTEAKLTAGEYALLHSGEFSWASLNFAKGRLVVEAAATGPSRTLPPERCTASGQNAAALFCARTLPAAPCWCSRGQQVEAGQASLAQPAPSGTAP